MLQRLPQGSTWSEVPSCLDVLVVIPKQSDSYPLNFPVVYRSFCVGFLMLNLSSSDNTVDKILNL